MKRGNKKKKYNFRDINTKEYGEYNIGIVKKGQKGIGAGIKTVVGGGNWRMPMSGFMQSGIQIEGQDGVVRGNPYVTQVVATPIDWKEKEIDLKEAFKAMQNLKSPLTKLFDIEGLDMKHLLPVDISHFNTVKTALMNKYLGEIQKVAPNMTYEDLLKPDVKMAVEQASQRYKNAVINLYNQLKSNKDMYDKDAQSRGSIETTLGKYANMDEGYNRQTKYVDVNNGGFFQNYIKRDRNGNAVLDVGDIVNELDEQGTASKGVLLNDVRQYMPLNLSENIQKFVVSNISADSIGKVKALNSSVYKEINVGGITTEKVSEVSKSALDGIMKDEKNNSDFIIEAVNSMRNIFGTVKDENGNRKELSLGDVEKIIEDYQTFQRSGGLDRLSKRANAIEEQLKQSNIGEKEKAELEAELSNIQNYVYKYASVMSKRDIGEMKNKTYIEQASKEGEKIKNDIENNRESALNDHLKEEEIGGKKYYVLDNTYFGEEIVGKNGKRLRKKVLVYKEGNKKDNKVFYDDDAMKEFINKKGKDITIEGIREEARALPELDTDEIQFMPDNSPMEAIRKNLILGDIYKRIVNQASTKLQTKTEEKLLFKPVAPSISISNKMGGGEIKEDDNLPSWAFMRANAFGLKFNAVSWESFRNDFIKSNGNAEGFHQKDKDIYMTNAPGLKNSSAILAARAMLNGNGGAKLYNANGDEVNLGANKLKELAVGDVKIAYKIDVKGKEKFITPSKLDENDSQWREKIIKANNSLEKEQTGFTPYKVVLEKEYAEQKPQKKFEDWVKTLDISHVDEYMAKWLHKIADPYYLVEVHDGDNNQYFLEMDGGPVFASQNMVGNANMDAQNKNRLKMLNALFKDFRGKTKLSEEEKKRLQEDLQKLNPDNK
jgi:hypothetical protein